MSANPVAPPLSQEPWTRPREALRSSAPSRRLWWVTFGIVLAAALAPRLWSIHDVPGNGFYDAAVRSMGQSWHSFFFGSLVPGDAISIDKPPVDLWLQVLATKSLGYGLFALHLPESLGGASACALLFAALYRPFGVWTALLGGLLLAALPVAVLTSRSDTMDSLMAAFEVLAVWLSWVALHRRQVRWSILAAAVMGIAFNVKLTESLLVLPALLLMWFWAAPPGVRTRALLASCSTFLVFSLSWASVASLTPSNQRPFPIGSENGSVWQMIFVYNGLDRFTGQGVVGLAASRPGSGPGILRLLDSSNSSYGVLIGFSALAALLLGALALLELGHERLRGAWHSPAGRFAIALAVWFLSGLIFFSVMRRLQTRYLEAFTPALCAILAIGLHVLLRSRKRAVALLLGVVLIVLALYLVVLDNGLSTWTVASLAALAVAFGVVVWRPASPRHDIRRRTLLAVLLTVGLLAASIGTDTSVIARNHSDSVLFDPTTPSMSHYLAVHSSGIRFELASANVFDIVGLVARDGRPVIMLNDVDGKLKRTSRLRAQVLAGEVRFFYAAHDCHSRHHCPSNERWSYDHSVPVAQYPGLRRFDLKTGGASAPDGQSSNDRSEE